jgi:hypothetical protein
VSVAIILAVWMTRFTANAADSTEDTTTNWNFERVGAAVLPNGDTDPQSYSKLSPWPYTDGNLIYSGCYDPAPLLTNSVGCDRCFATIDVSDPKHPKEVGRYLYKINDDYKGVTDVPGQDTYDVILGPNNYLYVSDGTAGLRVIRYTGPNGFNQLP